MSRVPILINEHAVERYRERVGPLPSEGSAARLRMFGEIIGAKEKYLKRLAKRFERRTCMLPTRHAIFIFSYGRLVTVLGREAKQ